jgi:hypothetical protein
VRFDLDLDVQIAARAAIAAGLAFTGQAGRICVPLSTPAGMGITFFTVLTFVSAPLQFGCSAA